MFKVAVAHSLELDSADAAAEILDQCREQLGDLKPQAGIMFAGVDHNHARVLKRIMSVYPGMELIGCTTGGKISSILGHSDDAIVLMAFYSDELVFKAGVAENISQDTVNTTRKAVDSVLLELNQEPTICVATPNGWNVNIDDVLEGFRQSLAQTFPLFGGVATDQWQVDRQYQCTFYNDAVFTDSLPFLLIAGPLIYFFGVGIGSVPIGPKGTVTKSDSNFIYEINNEPALQFCKHFSDVYQFENSKNEWIVHPIAVFENKGESFYPLIARLSNTKPGALVFAGNVPEGAMVQMAHDATKDRTVETAAVAIDTSITGYTGTEPVAVLCFSCNSRKLSLGSRVDEEYLAIKNRASDLPVAGFYTYVEIAPIGISRPAICYNSAFVSLVMGVK